MPKHRYDNVTISWPRDDQTVRMLHVDDEEKDAVEFTDLLLQILFIEVNLVNKEPEPELNEDDSVPFLTILYPEKMRFYINKRRISSEHANSILSRGIRKMIRQSIAHFEALAEKAE